MRYSERPVSDSSNGATSSGIYTNMADDNKMDQAESEDSEDIIVDCRKVLSRRVLEDSFPNVEIIRVIPVQSKERPPLAPKAHVKSKKSTPLAPTDAKIAKDTSASEPVSQVVKAMKAKKRHRKVSYDLPGYMKDL